MPFSSEALAKRLVVVETFLCFFIPCEHKYGRVRSYSSNYLPLRRTQYYGMGMHRHEEKSTENQCQPLLLHQVLQPVAFTGCEHFTDIVTHLLLMSLGWKGKFTSDSKCISNSPCKEQGHCLPFVEDKTLPATKLMFPGNCWSFNVNSP